MEVVRALQGAYALLFKSVHYPGELVGCKRGSPLLIAIKPEFAALATPVARPRASRRRWKRARAPRSAPS